MLLSYLIWDTLPEFFYFPDFLPLMGGRPVRYYGLLFALGFIVSQQIMFYIYNRENKPEKDVETLTVFMVIATIIGARLGHVLFYEPDKYLANPIEILKIWEGGLASHGAAFGILFALWLYSKYDVHFKGIKPVFTPIKRPGQSYLQVVDRIVIVVALTGCLIRFGNFMNSEIYGKPTHSNYGVVFGKDVREFLERPSQTGIENVDYQRIADLPPNDEQYVPINMILTYEPQDNVNTRDAVERFVLNNIPRYLSDSRYYLNDHFMYDSILYKGYEVVQLEDNRIRATVPVYGIVRHPTQLYESATSLLLFFLLFAIWFHYKSELPEGLLLGLFLIILFGLRFVHELFKENQVAFEEDLTFNMGQILSIPLIIAGIFILFRALKRGREPKTIK
ncbi:prolipoprotein diacylglyceryl transferase [Fulvivirga sedimenti]|uniref:Phosphatidylglycerol--prolipoprotein diacylglyceryl transferase n=1 Tax=Fulvivirga sedimenti TaxID=2879465 RepID=A0A9X1HRX4_9BACT|nr:prolipoprotein diacylglyceryl transferase [Fulvivirga sedimenti]MCA6075409.1 prolipoprotein diacylglyceryl transferase [Fulvivirga sedimenti]MCA6076586.1 prolipoprotein diacylglyceryl transferase [Fulvivirga sedimenti]MCA6077714.1 prolipoprotein diacylglyceryl transferase [Fulvivirga sedimenti]